MASLALLVVAVHAFVILGHDAAHRGLGVELNAWQTIFAYAVIVTAPIAAAILVWTRCARFGFALLAVSMLGALLFGVYHHYVLISPDHVHHLPPGDAQGLFRATAAAMPAIELAGFVLGVWAWRREAAPAGTSLGVST